ncbi:MAG: DUF1844 domain-containing protein, partial [Planctomycetes bacterium]|nr:DUF1844 domain-containing protein [Planctomycetota bacterium]
QQSAPVSHRVSLLGLVEQLAAQAMAALGQLPDPHTGQRFYDPELARDAIDMLGVIQDKTRGNLTPEEARVMNEILQSVRLLFARVGRSAMQQAGAAARTPPGAGAGPEPR